LDHKTLWQNFYSTIELSPTVVEETVEGDVKTVRLRFKGRALHGDRVDIYAEYMRPAADDKAALTPPLLILGDLDGGVDTDLMKMFYSFGYSVLMPDYSGYKEFTADYTRYPDSMSYANFKDVGDSLYSAPNGADKTCWFEWCCVARFSYEYLKSISGKKPIGAVGVKAGGEILLKILPFCNITCAATINAFGWLSYRGINKFNSDEAKLSALSTDKAWLNYLTALDSQNYAPDINVPLLLLCTTHDEDVDMDRVYDTYSRLKSKEDSAILYGVHHMGCVGRTGMRDLTMFLSKYLDNREIYIPDVSHFEIKVDEDGDLVCVAQFDELGDVELYGVLCSEDSPSAADREWMLMPHKKTLEDGSEVYYINVTYSASTVYVFVFERYSNGFTSSSKMVSINLKDIRFKNKTVKSKVIYSSHLGADGFYLGDREKLIIAKYFIGDFSKVFAEEVEGYGGIKGLLCDRGIITYRVGMTKYSPEQNSLLSFDLCSKKTCDVTFKLSFGGGVNKKEYSASFHVEGGRIWKKYISAPDDFKCGKEKLSSFSGVVLLSVAAGGDSSALVNNIAWL